MTATSDSERDEQRDAALELIDATAKCVAAQLQAALAVVNDVPNINFARKRLLAALDELPTGQPVGSEDAAPDAYTQALADAEAARDQLAAAFAQENVARILKVADRLDEDSGGS